MIIQSVDIGVGYATDTCGDSLPQVAHSFQKLTRLLPGPYLMHGGLRNDADGAHGRGINATFPDFGSVEG